jgi:hypothetical protein
MLVSTPNLELPLRAYIQSHIVIVVYNSADREHDMILYLPPSMAKAQNYVQHFVASFKSSITGNCPAKGYFYIF